MSPGVVAVVFLLVAAAEVPDKTMIATIVMGSRYPPVLVWAGAAAGFLVQVAIAVAAGRLLELLPHQTLEIVVTALFFLGACLLLFVPTRHGHRKGRPNAAGEAAAAPGEAAAAPGDDTHAQAHGSSRRVGIARIRRAAAGVVSGLETEAGAAAGATRAVVPWKVVLLAFAVIALGEFGDLTQLLLMNLVGKYHEPWAVFVGGSAALLSMSAAGAFGGRALLRWLPLERIRIAGGLALAGFAAYGIYALAT